jgi:hypothetical protein
MFEPDDAEKGAIDRIGTIVRFAAEKIDQLDNNIVLTLESARESAASNNWTPAISQNFWSAYHDLCIAIRPVTIECLAAARSAVPSFDIWRLRRKSTTLPARTSARYLWLLFGTLTLSIPLQFYVWVSAIEAKRIDDLTTSLKTSYTQFVDVHDKLENFLDEDESKNQVPFKRPEEGSQVALLCHAEQAFNSDISRLIISAQELNQYSLTRILITEDPVSLAQCYSVWSAPYGSTIDRYQRALAESGKVQEIANLESGVILSFILPVLFGFIGAITFVVREISNQVKASTFSPVSPLRHLMRATLGALAGVVVGLFTGLSTKFDLPPLAFAFLAGYGVESLFSMFDGIISKFRT